MRIERTATLCLGLVLLASGCRQVGGQAFAAVSPSQVACVEAAPTSGDTARVVAAAKAFASTLDQRQRADLQHPLEVQYAIRWSNFPSPLVRRNGVAFGDMNLAQEAAAKTLILSAAGACGARMFEENRGADVLGQRTVSTVNPARPRLRSVRDHKSSRQARLKGDAEDK